MNETGDLCVEGQMQSVTSLDMGREDTGRTRTCHVSPPGSPSSGPLLSTLPQLPPSLPTPTAPLLPVRTPLPALNASSQTGGPACLGPPAGLTGPSHSFGSVSWNQKAIALAVPAEVAEKVSVRDAGAVPALRTAQQEGHQKLNWKCESGSVVEGQHAMCQQRS